MTIALVAFNACGGSSADDDGTSWAGSGGAASIAGNTGTQAGNTGTQGGYSSGGSGSSGSANGGKQATGGSEAGGKAGMGQDDGGRDAGGAPGEPPKPGGMAGAGGPDADCPLTPPSNMAGCADLLKCNYPGLECKCEGREDERSWKCKEPPTPMNMCPAMAPEEASPCKTKDVEPPPPPCHYEDPAKDCTCTADKWACVEAP